VDDGEVDGMTQQEQQETGGGPGDYPLTPRGIHRAAVDSEALPYTAPSLVFMVFVLAPLVAEPSPARIVATALLTVAYIYLFLYLGGIRHGYHLRVAVWWLVAMWLVFGGFVLVLGADALYMVMFMVIAHGVVLPWRIARVVMAPLAVVLGVLGLVFDRPIVALLALVGVVVAFGVASGIHRGMLEDELVEAKERNAVLAVAAERERIGRDLHDILGHSLTTITVSAQLADRLVEADPEAARAQIQEIERISRQSLADVRTTASGMQQVRVASEIASARAVLTAAGIEAEAPTALPILEEDRAELFGYVVREGVTNVVRHAQATRCRIEVDRQRCAVTDDGVGIPARARRTGLAGLAARVEDAGGVLDVRAGTGDHGTVLEARMES
jgi:two-component system sensor histidine kinase DesK